MFATSDSWLPLLDFVLAPDLFLVAWSLAVWSIVSAIGAVVLQLTALAAFWWQPVGLVLAWLAVAAAVCALVLGVRGVAEANRQRRSSGPGIAGIVLGLLSLPSALLVVGASVLLHECARAENGAFAPSWSFSTGTGAPVHPDGSDDPDSQDADGQDSSLGGQGAASSQDADDAGQEAGEPSDTKDASDNHASDKAGPSQGAASSQGATNPAQGATGQDSQSGSKQGDQAAQPAGAARRKAEDPARGNKSGVRDRPSEKRPSEKRPSERQGGAPSPLFPPPPFE